MLAARADDAASSPRWRDLLLDLLGDISGRLHAAADHVRFHAVCKPWRHSLTPVQSRPTTLLPWLLAPRDASTGRRKARCVLSSNSSIATEICDRGRTWVVRAEDGVAYWFVADRRESSSCLIDPITGSVAATLLRCPDEIASWVDSAAAGTICGDGTIVLYALCPPLKSYDPTTFNVALLRPGDTAWKSAQRKNLYVKANGRDRCCVTYRNGKIIVCHDRSFRCISPARPEPTTLGEGWRWWMQDELGKEFQSSYLVESCGELLWVFVQVKRSYHNNMLSYGPGDVVGSLANALSVSVYALQEEEDDEGGKSKQPQWVKRDGRSLADRVLFLGRPSSFAVDAARLGVSGGCAYFIDRRWLYDGFLPLDELCRLFKYNFHDDKSEIVEQLPLEEWKVEGGMWLTPQPAIAPTKEFGWASP